MRLALAALVLAVAPAQAQVAEQCENGADEDADGLADCADTDCVSHPVCERSFGVVENEIPERAPEPAPRPLERPDPRRYPQKHVAQPLTYLSGMLVPAVGISARDDLALSASIVHVGLGLAYGILDFWEIVIVPVAVRALPIAAYEAPSISTTVRVLEHEVVELGLYANVAIPVTSVAGEPERLPNEHLLARSRSGGSAELDVALLLRLHLAEIVRIDAVLPVATFVLSQPARADFTIPLRVVVQVTPFAYFGLWTGLILPGPDYGAPKMALGISLGTTIPGDERGPLIDAAVRFGWPTFYDPARVGGEVSAEGWQITIDARMLTYLLP